jgi:starch synthase
MGRKRYKAKNPKILVVTPEITYLPQKMTGGAANLSAKAGGLADVSASLVSALFEMGADIHVAMPYYRRIFNLNSPDHFEQKREHYKRRLSQERIHFAQDRIFFYRDRVYSGYHGESMKISLAFQREVINNIIPSLQPDLIHCNDWMTGLIPSFARRMKIPSLFTVHNIHTQKTTVETIENGGIDAAFFWKNIYFERAPFNYEESRSGNPVDLLTSGIFAAHFINTVSPTFLKEIVDGVHDSFVPWHIRQEMCNKYYAGCAKGILNAPDPDNDPETDSALAENFSAESMAEKKWRNKVAFQKAVGLHIAPDSPLFFWPSRLDPKQKGPQLLAEILFQVINEYWPRQPQFAFVANGEYQSIFKSIADHHGFQNLVAVMDFNDELSRLGYAASDFILMPSRFEPCGLPQMIGPIHGSLPIVHDTGGLHDTVTHLDSAANQGNGFVFKFFDGTGLHWAIQQAMNFYQLTKEEKNKQIRRIMQEAKATFNHANTANAYIKIYEQMLERPLVHWHEEDN